MTDFSPQKHQNYSMLAFSSSGRFSFLMLQIDPIYNTILHSLAMLIAGPDTY